MDLPYDATYTTLALAALGAFCLGISKTGFPGLAILNVLIVAELFGAVLTSWDGVTWTNVGELPDFDRDPRLAFGNGVFVAAGKKDNVAASQICYSPDGRTWTKRGDMKWASGAPEHAATGIITRHAPMMRKRKCQRSGSAT